MGKPAHQFAPEKKVGPALRALRERYGTREWSPDQSPLEVLVRGVLSQNTSDVNSARAYESLREEFPAWEELAGAEPARIAAAIQSGGLAEQKAATIKAVLDWLGGRDGYSLDFLRGMGSEEAERELTAVKGVGVKTARLVLLFGLGRASFVVDTHVLRVSRRLGLVAANCGRNKAHVLLDELVPDEAKYEGHLNMIAHGRETCHARSPQCDGCPVRRWCLYVRGEMA